ncbi:MAG: TetR/AcrR family transcriptional regulator [Acutalibacteraceae bacterium]
MSGNSKTTNYLKECISDAILDLLNSKPLNKITSDEIAEKAGVGRATYFRYFNTKEDALVFKLTALWNRYCDEHNIRERSNFDLENATAFYDFNYEIKSVLNILYSSALETVVFDSFKTIMLRSDSSQLPEKWYREKFFSYGLYGLLDGWIRREYKETPEQMAEITIEIMKQ